jgi:hypothetical protein
MNESGPSGFGLEIEVGIADPPNMIIFQAFLDDNGLSVGLGIGWSLD